MSKRTAFVREVVKEVSGYVTYQSAALLLSEGLGLRICYVCLGDQLLTMRNSLAPYERRVIELLRNSKDKRARKLAKKRVSLFVLEGSLDETGF